MGKFTIIPALAALGLGLLAQWAPAQLTDSGAGYSLATGFIDTQPGASWTDGSASGSGFTTGSASGFGFTTGSASGLAPAGGFTTGPAPFTSGGPTGLATGDSTVFVVGGLALGTSQMRRDVE